MELRASIATLLLLVTSGAALSGCAVATPRQQNATPRQNSVDLMQIGALDFTLPQKVKFTVDVSNEEYYRTDSMPGLVRGLFRVLPSLKRHKCHNDYGYTFEREAKETELPHLLEHLTLELEALSGSNKILKGETSWNWRKDPRGRFHVEVGYQHKELAAESIRTAEKIIETLAQDEKAEINIDAELEHLRRARAEPGTRR